MGILKNDLLSPFRYPGGKSWLIPTIERWLLSFDQRWRREAIFLEPFAGGANVSLYVASRQMVKHVIIVERDDAVASVWSTIFYGDVDWLATHILDFKLTETAVYEILRRKAQGMQELAFQTLLRNRVSHGGIITDGAGILKRGQDDKGLPSRWYPMRLAGQIRKIAALNNRITFLHGDGLEALSGPVTNEHTLCFIDPPYTAEGGGAGTRLYTHFRVDHEALFKACATLGNRCLMTYDNVQEVRDLTHSYDLSFREVSMYTTHHKKKTELLIGSDFGWFDQPQQLVLEIPHEYQDNY